MHPLPTSFWQDVNSFVHNHKTLCVLTLGLAIVCYSAGNLAGRAVHFIIEAFGTTLKTDEVAKSTLKAGPPSSDQKKLPKDENNQTTLARLHSLIGQGEKLTSSRIDNKMVGQEHIAAILYQILIEEDKRKDCSLVISPSGNKIVPPDFKFTKANYYVFTLSTKDDSPLAILIIDKQNENYAYFDAKGGALADSLMQELREKGLIKHYYQQVQTPSAKFGQSDGATLSFHALHNALAMLDKDIITPNPAGDQLKRYYAPYYEKFASSKGFSSFDEARRDLNKKQKVSLRMALEKYNEEEDGRLKNLYDKLVSEQKPDNENRYRPLAEFANDYIESYPDDTYAKKILKDALLMNGAIFKCLPIATDETEEQIKSKIHVILDNIRLIMS